METLAALKKRIAELEACWNASDVLIGTIEDENKELRARIAKLQKERDLLFKAHHHEMMRADTAEARIAELEAALRDLQSYTCAGSASWAEDDEHAAMMSRVNCLLGDK